MLPESNPEMKSKKNNQNRENLIECLIRHKDKTTILNNNKNAIIIS